MRERLAAIGMPPSRIHVLGNAKYDGLAARVSPELKREIAGRLGIEPGEEVLVAGSTHEGEETVILEVYRRLLELRPDFKLICVPRHIERGEAVAELIRRAGFADFIRMSEILAGRQAPRGEGGSGRCDRRALQDLQPGHRRLLRGEPRCRRGGRTSSRPPPGERSSSTGRTWMISRTRGPFSKRRAPGSPSGMGMNSMRASGNSSIIRICCARRVRRDAER